VFVFVNHDFTSFEQPPGVIDTPRGSGKRELNILLLDFPPGGG